MNKRQLTAILKPVKGMSVINMTNPNSHNKISNQFIIHTATGSIFQSYTTIIAVKTFGQPTILDEQAWDYSRTTGKYRNQFLNERIADTRRKIENGTYILTDLNQ